MFLSNNYASWPSRVETLRLAGTLAVVIGKESRQQRQRMRRS
jgi:hypothetical protein